MPYPDVFKNAMVQKMTGPDAISATALARQVDVPQTTLSKWLRQTGADPSYCFPNNTHRNTQMTDTDKPKRPADWSAEEKLKAVVEAEGLSDEQLGAFLRKNGIHKVHLDCWRVQILEGLGKGHSPTKSRRRDADAKRIRALEKELNRKEKALAETAALLVLKKKALEIWGDEESATSRNNGK
jgi:transposase-like protein